MKDEYADVKQDLYGAFVVRGIELANGAGLLAIVIGDTWMSIKSFESLRQRLLTGHAFSSFVHMHDVSNHPDIFGANAAFVLAMSGDKQRLAPFIRLASLGQERKEAALKRALQLQTAKVGFHRSAGMHFEAIPGSPIVYWLSEKMRSAFSHHQTVGDYVTTREGLTTGDNSRFLRLWWEPSSQNIALPNTTEEYDTKKSRWFAYLKGGSERRWSGNFDYVVDWEFDGQRQRTNIDATTGRIRSHNYNGDWAFRPGFTWTSISSGRFCGRFMGRGFMFDAKGPVAFPHNMQDSRHLLGVLNSNVGIEFLRILAPTMDFKLGQVERVPLPTPWRGGGQQIDRTTESLKITALDDWDQFENSWGFLANPLISLAWAS